MALFPRSVCRLRDRRVKKSPSSPVVLKRRLGDEFNCNICEAVVIGLLGKSRVALGEVDPLSGLVRLGFVLGLRTKLSRDAPVLVARCHHAYSRCNTPRPMPDYAPLCHLTIPQVLPTTI